MAAYYNLTEIAEILIANGANLNKVSKRDTTPLMEAEMQGSKDTMELLIKNGAQK
jgi:ankyrin repeat protein